MSYLKDYEANVIGGLALDPSRLSEVDCILELSDFLDPFHRAAYQAIKRLVARGKKFFDGATLFHETKLGYPAATVVDVLRLIEYPTAVYTRHYAEMLIEERESENIKRNLQASSAAGTTTAIILSAEKNIAHSKNRTAKLKSTSKDISLRQVALDSLNSNEYDSSSGIPAATDGLQRALGGRIRSGSLVIVGARPSNGKTLFLLQSLYEAANAGNICGLISLEMSQSQIAERIRNTGGETAEQLEIFFQHQSVSLFSKPAATLNEIVDEVGRIKREYGATVIAIDYLGLIQSRGINRYEATTEASNRLKFAAVEHDVVIYLAAQLSRATEGRSPARPRTSDLRDSGAIEQDADYVLFLYWASRDQTLSEQQREQAGNAYEVHIAKNRFRGIPPGHVKMTIDPARQRITDAGESETQEPF